MDNDSVLICALYCRTLSPPSIPNLQWPRKGEHDAARLSNPCHREPEIKQYKQQPSSFPGPQWAYVYFVGGSNQCRESFLNAAR